MAGLNAASAAFQFHKGTIRTLTLLCVILFYVYFNSIKVQLERIKKIAVDINNNNFNSIKVQLEHSTGITELLRIPISIP